MRLIIFNHPRHDLAHSRKNYRLSVSYVITTLFGNPSVYLIFSYFLIKAEIDLPLINISTCCSMTVKLSPPRLQIYCFWTAHFSNHHLLN